MSTAIGRLWRRAPAWRFALFMGIGFAALTALFPPPLHWIMLLHRAAPDRPRFHPPAAPPDKLSGNFLTAPLGAGRVGTIAFAGRQVPLPQPAPGGDGWQPLGGAQVTGAESHQVEVLSQVTAGKLAGLLVLLAPAPIGAAGRLDRPDGCLAPDAILHHIGVPDPGNPLSGECWVLERSVDLSPPGFGPDGKPKPDPFAGVLRLALDRLSLAGTPVTGPMTVLELFRSAPTGWLDVQLLAPPALIADQAAIARMKSWIDTALPILQRGFYHQLAATDALPSLPVALPSPVAEPQAAKPQVHVQAPRAANLRSHPPHMTPILPAGAPD